MSGPVQTLCKISYGDWSHLAASPSCRVSAGQHITSLTTAVVMCGGGPGAQTEIMRLEEPLAEDVHPVTVWSIQKIVRCSACSVLSAKRLSAKRLSAWCGCTLLAEGSTLTRSGWN